jgi:hypothetical protein
MSVAHDSLLYSRVETVLASEIADGVLRVGDQLALASAHLQAAESSPPPPAPLPVSRAAVSESGKNSV